MCEIWVELTEQSEIFDQNFLMTEIFLFEFKLYVYFKIDIMVNFGIPLHTLYIECNMHLLASLCNIGAKSANMRVW